MNCPRCSSVNPDTASVCSACGADLLPVDQTVERRSPVADRVPTAVHTPEPSPPPRSLGEWKRERKRISSELTPGFEIGNRYRVIRPLGRGGMGMVYLVVDKDLQRQVALKLILPEFGENEFMLERFRREILLSTRITHPNVLRVYDLGESDGVKFLTMEYVDGEDLADLMGHGERLPIDKVVSLFRQICAGLAAAHAIGVIHRDLKPQNVMVDRKGKVFLSDFGLARTVEQTNLTVTGAVIGTPHYMSPEQVKGTTVDQRSDIYALGVMLYEMLAGDVPFGGDSAYEIMIKRVHSDPRPIHELNPDTPRYLAKILDRCLAVDPDRRYQSLDQAIRDLDAAGAPQVAAAPHRVMRWALPAVVLVLVAALVTSLLWRNRRPTVAAVHKSVSVLISDFRNDTGEPVFDGTLEPAMSLALEGAPFITAYNRGSARKIAGQLQNGASALSEPAARLVAGREGINVVVAGAITKQGSGYDVAAHAIDAITGKQIATHDVSASSKDEVLTAASKVAAALRKDLGDSTPESASIAAAETVSASSLDAAHAYAQAQELLWAGRFEEAIPKYTDAIKFDPNLGRAYAGRAAARANLGLREDAEADYKMAMAHIDRMTDREKFRTRGGYYLLVRNSQGAIDEFSALARQFPADTGALNNLAFAYFYGRDMTRALEEGRKPVAIYPKNVLHRNNLALYAMYAGDFKTAEQEAQTVLQMNPAYVKAYVALALSQLAQNQPVAAIETYQRLAKVSARGASVAAIGLADVALLQGRLADATAILRKAAADDQAAKNHDAASIKLAALAESEYAAGRKDAAVTAAGEASAVGKDVNVAFPSARVFIAAGRPEKARALAGGLGVQIESDPQLYAKLIEGEMLLAQGNAREALNRFNDAQKFGDSWLGRFDLGRAYLELGAFTEASSELDRCVKRRGEATAVFLDDVPSYRYFAPVYYYVARAQQGLGSPNAGESYRVFIALRPSASNDPLVIDAQKRLAAMK